MQVFLACHYHACNPEEDDVGSRHQDRSGIVVLDLFVVGRRDALEERDGPEPGGEPCVECILIMTEVFYLEFRHVVLLACLL